MLGETAKVAEDIYVRNTIASLSEREREGLTDPELRKLLLENLARQAEDYPAHLTQKHVKAYPESARAIVTIKEVISSKSVDLTADLAAISRTMT